MDNFAEKNNEMSTSEKYFSEALLGKKPKKPLSVIIKDYAVTTQKIADKAVTEDKLAVGSVTTDKISDGSVTADKLSFALLDEVSEFKSHKGMVIACSVLDEAEQADTNEGIVDTFIYHKGKLKYKTGEETADGETIGKYEEVPLYAKDLYVDSNTGIFYTWNGERMVPTAVPITNIEIDDMTEVDTTSSGAKARKAVIKIIGMARKADIKNV